MADIIQFPTNKLVADRLMEALDREIDALDEAYEQLDILHLQMHELEKACHQRDYTFDYNLMKYAHQVGLENVPVRFLGYTTRHRVHMDFTDGSFQLELFEEDFDD